MILNDILGYAMAILAVATVISYVWYRKAQPTSQQNNPITHNSPTLASPPFPHIPNNLGENTETEERIIMPQTEKYDLKTELEKVFVKKIETGELQLDLEPITDGRVSDKNALEILGIKWQPKIVRTQKQTETEQPTPEIPELDPDRIPEDIPKAEEETSTPKGKKKEKSD